MSNPRKLRVCHFKVCEDPLWIEIHYSNSYYYFYRRTRRSAHTATQTLFWQWNWIDRYHVVVFTKLLYVSDSILSALWLYFNFLVSSYFRDWLLYWGRIFTYTILGTWRLVTAIHGEIMHMSLCITNVFFMHHVSLCITCVFASHVSLYASHVSLCITRVLPNAFIHVSLRGQMSSLVGAIFRAVYIIYQSKFIKQVYWAGDVYKTSSAMQ